MLRRLAPAATPITLKELFTSGLGLFGTNKEVKRFEESFAKRMGLKRSFAVSSGRAGLYLILETLKRISARREIIIPAYSCPSIAASAVKAGLKVVLCDISTSGFGYDPAQLNKLMGEDTLAVIYVPLFGIPVEMEQIHAKAKEKGIFVIEDMAQSMGPEAKGDLIFYSLGRGKNITTSEGGIIGVNNSEYAKEIMITLQGYKQPGIAKSLRIFLNLALIPP